MTSAKQRAGKRMAHDSDDAESGMWKRKGTRTNPAEVERLLRARTLILAECDFTVWQKYLA